MTTSFFSQQFIVLVQPSQGRNSYSKFQFAVPEDVVHAYLKRWIDGDLSLLGTINAPKSRPSSEASEYQPYFNTICLPQCGRTKKDIEEAGNQYERLHGCI